MKISVNTINKLNTRYKTLGSKLDLKVDDLAIKIGSQLGAVEEIIPVGEKYKGVVIAKVISCEQHPNADRLHVCLIDDGQVVKEANRNEQGLVQVVCGAPNVREGLSVAWLPPGSTVPETFSKDPFVLEARELRGVVSNGMLASPKELALGDNHEGILEIEDDHVAGEDFAKAFGLENDSVIDIENKMFTHRPDCFGLLGVAREIAGINRVKFISPDWYTLNPKMPTEQTNELPITVINELPELVPRFTAIAISGVKVKPSPVWLQVELAKVGLRPINNLVDLTNWYMLLTGQPLHAYDYDKVRALSSSESATLVIRKPKNGEKLKLLNGKEIAPRSEAILIATDKQAIGLGGVMGGSETEVDDSTKNIIIECANFDMYSTRRTSMEHGLFSDAATRFTKGQSPLQNPAVALKIASSITESSDAKIASQLIDDNHLNEVVMSRGSMHEPVTLSADFINTRLGLELTNEQIAQLLENVDFKVEAKGTDITFSAPFWRTDIELPEDIVEEVGRLYGYDELPLTLPRRDLTPARKDPLLEAKQAIRTHLSNVGANEVLTYSFLHSDLLAKVGQDKTKAFEVGNALRPELQYYRISLMPSLLEKVYPNHKAGQDRFALFEIGKVHSTDWINDDGLPREDEYTCLVVSHADKLKQASSAYYEAKRILSLLCAAELDFKPLTEEALMFPVTKPYEPKRSAMVYLKSTNEFLGLVGEFNAKTRRALKLPKYSAGFELDTTKLSSVVSKDVNYVAISRFPKVTQDISLKVDGSLSYQALFNEVSEALNRLKPSDSIIEISPKDIYQGEDKNHKNITLSLNISSYSRTLTDQEVNSLIAESIDVASHKLGIERL